MQAPLTPTTAAAAETILSLGLRARAQMPMPHAAQAPAAAAAAAATFGGARAAGTVPAAAPASFFTFIAPSSGAVDEESHELAQALSCMQGGNVPVAAPQERPFCRKCRTSYEDDQDDLISCSMCSTVFHGACEEPSLDWLPTKAFCSPACFDRFKASDAGQRLFRRNILLESGHLRPTANCLAEEALPQLGQVCCVFGFASAFSFILFVMLVITGLQC